LLELPGVGALTAAKLTAEIAGIERFRNPAKLARLAGIAPIPAPSGNTTRHRPDRGGNRQLNAAVHRIAITQPRCHQPARDYLARRLSDGKTKREAIRCLKRHLVRTIHTTMTTSHNTPTPTPALTQEQPLPPIGHSPGRSRELDAPRDRLTRRRASAG
jgi:transposase